MIISSRELKNVIQAQINGSYSSDNFSIKKNCLTKTMLPFTDQYKIRNQIKKISRENQKARKSEIALLKYSIRKGTYYRSSEEIANKIIARSIVDLLLK